MRQRVWFGPSLIAVALALVLGGCGPSPSSGPATRGPATPSPTTELGSTPPTSQRPSASPAAIPLPVPSASGDEVAGPCDLSVDDPGSSPPAVIEPTLLGRLPPAVGGVAMTPCPAAVVDMTGDPILTDVDALDIALYASLDDYAVATIARPRAGTYSEAWFRDWRDTFEAGVCEAGGGADPGRSEFEVGGRTVYRSTCAGGVVMYQTYLEGPGVVVSIQGLGPQDLGRQIAAGVKE